MTFELMNQLGLSGIDYSYIFIGLAGISLLLLILVIIQMCQINSLKNKYKKFMGNSKEAKSFEKQIERIFEDNNYIKEVAGENKKDIRSINKELETCFNKVGIVKYDAFKQMGGMLSFSLALLNEIDNGFILNSVHSADGCYVYIKEIKSGMSEIELSSEEKNALSQAMKNK